jgi:MFS family permease
MEYYFRDVLRLGTDRSRLYSTLVVLANGVGMVLGGWLGDRARHWSPRRGLALVPAGGLIGSAVFLVAGLLTAEAEWTLVCFIAAMGALGMCEGPCWTIAVALGGRRGGTTAALMNTGGNAGGLLAPVVTPQLSQYFGWQVGMGLASLVALLGAVLWVGINPHGGMDTEGQSTASV